MHKYLIFTGLLFVTIKLSSQELNCGVTVNADQLSQTDAKVFKTLETAIFEFMNNRKWTDDVFKPEERIDCQLVITVTEEESSDNFNAQANIVSRRPVFGSDYNSTLINFQDKDWEFQYAEYQPLEYNENQFVNNLTSMLAYYAYIIIGFDYDSFSPKGGDKYFLKAQSIVNQASNREESGWKSYDGSRNRYWLVTNLLDPKFSGFRDAFYQYHRQALDLFYDDQLKPVTTITKTLQTFDNINRTQPNSMIMQLFFSAKSAELAGIYTNSNPAEKAKAVNLLMRLDPVNSDSYQQIMGAR